MHKNSDLSEYLLKKIRNSTVEASLMEVCGTHTMAIARSGIRSLAPPNIRLISGPGCPVCVTAQGDIDAVIDLAARPGISMVTFGDMMRVPGSERNLQEVRSQGADIRVVYSPMDALKMAEADKEREFVFLGIGFETTAPAVAACVEMAAGRQINNFSVFSLHKVVPPALEALFSDAAIRVDGLICPGHVSAVIGVEPYVQLAAKYHKPCVVAGFETMDILQTIVMLLDQLEKGECRAELQYGRVVRPEGNLIARALMDRVFQPVDARWRGLGNIPGSGLALADGLRSFDARVKFAVPEYEDREIKGCACGEVLTGRISPPECMLFGQGCTPLKPIGPCMVSHEGACAAYYRFAASGPVSGPEAR